MNNIINIGYGEVQKVSIGGDLPLVFIGGPCAIESRDHTIMMVEKIKEICEKIDIRFVFKACYDKDCRSSSHSFHGLGIEEGLEIFTCEIDQGIGVIVNKKNSSILKLDKPLNKIKFKDYYINYKTYMRIITLEKFKTIF